MQASDYIRKSECAQAMTKYCAEQGFTWSVQPPGSKGHPFLIITANGKRAKVPFSLTPSETRRAPMNAVSDLKRTLRDIDALPSDDAQPMKIHEVKPMAIQIQKTSTGAPVLPKNAHLKKNGRLAGGANPVNCAYSQAVDLFIAKRIKDGATVKQIAKELRAGGSVMETATVTQRAYRLRQDGRIPQTWTPNGGAPVVSHSAPQKELVSFEESPAPSERRAEPLTGALNGKFADLVTDALTEARTHSASAADAMARDWIEKIARARGVAEQRHYESRYLRVLDVLTS